MNFVKDFIEEFTDEKFRILSFKNRNLNRI